MLFVIVLLRWLQKEHPSRLDSLTAGLLSGLLVITTPPLLLVALSLIAVWLFRRPRRQVLILAVAFGAALLPWTIRNFIQLGGFVALRSNYLLGCRSQTRMTPTLNRTTTFAIRFFRHPSTSLAEALRRSPLRLPLVPALSPAAVL